MSGPFAYLTSSIDSALNTFVVDVSSSIAAGIAPLVAMGVTIWILMYGYAVMRQEVSDPINVFIKNVFKISLILGIGVSAGIYQNLIVGSVNDLADGLVLFASNGKTAGGVFAVLDTLVTVGMTTVMKIIWKGLLNLPSGALDIVAAFCLAAALAVLLVVIGVLATAAKIALAMVLAFGPLFISTLVFKPIAHWFQQWLNKVANYVVLMAITSAFATLALTIANVYLQNMATNDSSSPLRDIFGFVLIIGVMAGVAKKYLPEVAAGLTGGAALASIGGIGGIGGGGGGGGTNNPGPKGGGGSITEDKSGGGGKDDSGTRNIRIGSNIKGPSTSSSGYVPAYQRASRTRYGPRK